MYIQIVPIFLIFTYKTSIFTKLILATTPSQWHSILKNTHTQKNSEFRGQTTKTERGRPRLPDHPVSYPSVTTLISYLRSLLNSARGWQKAEILISNPFGRKLRENRTRFETGSILLILYALEGRVNIGFVWRYLAMIRSGFVWVSNDRRWWLFELWSFLIENSFFVF